MHTNRALSTYVLLAPALAECPLSSDQIIDAPEDAVAGIPVNATEAHIGRYTLPDPLTLANGERVKDSSGNVATYRNALELKRVRPDWSVLIGPGRLMVESVGWGGDGGDLGL